MRLSRSSICAGFAFLGCYVAVVSVLSHPLHAAEQVDLVLSPNAPKLEQTAADELTAQFQRLFDVEIVRHDDLPTASRRLVLIGSPQTNAAVGAVLGDDWPNVGQQGIVIRSFSREGQQGVIVGGGSPVATLWAVYELGYRHGIRYLLRGDSYPTQTVPLKLDELDIVQEPTLETRTWRTINDFAIGPESWSLDDHRRFLRQLAKMKFNRVMLSVYPWHPFVHYEFGGVKKQTGVLWYGDQYRVDGDTPGRAAFRGAKIFHNPDFAQATNYDDMVAAGRTHMQGIIDAAKELGMSVGLSISPLEFPREFAAVLPGSKVATSLKQLTILPGSQQGPGNRTLQNLVKAKLRAYLDSYQGIDAIYFNMPEFPEWHEHAVESWDALNMPADTSLEDVVARARERNLIASGERGAQSVKGNVVALAFLKKLLSDPDLLKTHDGRQVNPVLAQIDPALFPVLENLLPENTSTLHFIDYTARRIVENQSLLQQVPAEKVSSSLILTLADDNVGILSQSATGRIEDLITELRKNGWKGFSTRYWIPAELDATVHYLSRVSFDPKVTARTAHNELFIAMTGNRAAADRLWLCFEHIEAATELIDQHDIGFAFPVEGMLMKHYVSEPIPEWWAKVNEHYTQAMIELYRSHDAVDPSARKLLYYYAKRSEYVLEYLGCVTALREAAIAQKAGDIETAIEKLEASVESLYNALDTLGDIAQDQSDRGLIAVLNAYAYRPLMAEYERVLDASESE